MPSTDTHIFLLKNCFARAVALRRVCSGQSPALFVCYTSGMSNAIKWSLVILALVFAFFWISTYIERSEDMPKDVLPPPPPVAAFESEKVREKYYSIDLEYPKSSNSELPEISSHLDKVRSDFLELVPKTDEEAAYQGISEGRAYVLKMDTTIYTSSSTITYKLETYMFTGGAHGSTFVSTFTYTKDGKLIPLSNILSGPDSLAKLSSSARNYLYEKLSDQSSKHEIDTGTEPKEENWNAWYLTDHAITFIFQQYQIGPYVLGVQEFPMSRTEAKTILSI